MKNIIIASLFFLLLSSLAFNGKSHVSTNYIQYSTVSSGTITADDVGTDMVIIHEAAAIAIAMTINLPATPADAQRVTIMSVNGITALTLNSPLGGLTTTLTTLLSGNSGTYIWSMPRNKWYRIR